MVRLRMASMDDWEDDKILLDFLAKQQARGSLTLILGAGMSSHFGLPSWPKLIKRLFASKGSPAPKKDAKRQAEDYRSTYFPGDVPGFLADVKSSLYRDVKVDFGSMRSHNSLAAIASLAMGSRRVGVSEIVTFNFDDLLEIYLEYHGFVTVSVGDRTYWSKSGDVTVLHPHGLLPRSSRRTASADIVFDQYSYTEAIGTKGSAWRQLLLSIMRTHTCLFIGLSGDDDNLDSLLERCGKQHASRLDNSLFWGVAFSTTDKNARFWKRRGIFLKRVADYDQALAQFLFKICQGAAEIRSA